MRRGVGSGGGLGARTGASLQRARQPSRTCAALQRELLLVEVEVLGGKAVEVGQGHVLVEERVPAGGVMHPAGEIGVRLDVEAPVQRGDDAVEEDGLSSS